MSEYDFYQIDSIGVDEPDRDANTRTDKAVPIRRALDAKISNFGAKNVGSRMSSDYTRTLLDFESKDELSDFNKQTEDSGVGQNVAGRGITVEHNPYLLGSTVKRKRDEQSFRLGMSDNRGISIDSPNFDVMDTNLIVSGMTAGKNWPSEGWRSFGGKYDFEPYQGGDIH